MTAEEKLQKIATLVEDQSGLLIDPFFSRELILLIEAADVRR